MGKTTTVRAVMGLNPPRGGSVTFRGEALAGLPPERVAQRGIGLVPEVASPAELSAAASAAAASADLARAYAALSASFLASRNARFELHGVITSEKVSAQRRRRRRRL